MPSFLSLVARHRNHHPSSPLQLGVVLGVFRLLDRPGASAGACAAARGIGDNRLFFLGDLIPRYSGFSRTFTETMRTEQSSSVRSAVH